MGEEFNYAGFWRRFQAWIIDTILMLAISVALSLVAGIALGLTLTLLEVTEPIRNLIYSNTGRLIGLAVFVLYFALFESSPMMATPGKRLLSIKVTDMSGERIGFLRAFGRLVGKLLSGFLFAGGFLITDFTARKQALHDILAHTLVVRSRRSELG